MDDTKPRAEDAAPPRHAKRDRQHRSRAGWDPSRHVTGTTAIAALVQSVEQLRPAWEVAAAEVDARRVLTAGSSSCDRAGDLLWFQIDHAEGPALDAFLGGEEQLDVDPAEPGPWAGFRTAALAAGYGMVHALPLGHGRDVVGVVFLGDRRHQPLDDDLVRTVRLLCELAAIAIVEDLARDHWEDRARQLQSALDGRVVIEQAKGVLAERFGTTPTAAFELLRAFARSHNRSVRELVDLVLGSLGGPASDDVPTPRLSPDEIATKRFRPVWRGCDREAVEAFLERAAADYSAALTLARDEHREANAG